MDKAIVMVSRQQQKKITVHLHEGETLEGSVIYADDKMFALRVGGQYKCIYFSSVAYFGIGSSDVFEQICETAKKDMGQEMTMKTLFPEK